MDEQRYNEIEKNLDSSMRMNLNQIRTFLNLRKASVMVGSGFSKNAERSEDIHMKDWGELCEDFYSALYNSQPSDRDFRLKSPLRLAQQIESTMGRAALDEIIKNSLPNDSISPGYLHKLLVGLNWRDIFTTNYDSLLEDAAIKAYRHYNIVTSKDSLIYQPHPRIIKLHGSFPDNRPFIITEEDYRTYPERFPEFVNTIRQALIETQFCLIGFSSDDPNFINWLGWFRDIMGSQMRPIYMIYVGDRPHESEIKLFRTRKIEPIITEDIVHDPIEAMEFILSYVGNKFQEDKKWSGSLKIKQLDKKGLKDLIDEMRKIRKSYPGWTILPANRIEIDFEDCHSEFALMDKSFSELEDKDKLDFIYEYTWRHQTAFMPLWFTPWYIDAIQEILTRYESLDVEERNKADYLSVVLLQIYRITNDEKFKPELQRFRNRISQNKTVLHCRLNYEESLWDLSHCEFTELDKILDTWRVTADDYQGALWKSKVLKEVDKNEEATKILETALGKIRRKLMSKSTSEDLLSAASIISDRLHRNNQSTDSDQNFRFWKYCDLCKKEMKTEEISRITYSRGFNIGTHSTSWNSGRYGYIKKYVGAGRYFLMTEAYGMPIGTCTMSYNTNINQLALALISKINLDTTISYLIESNDKNALKTALSREAILNISEESATRLFDSLINVLEHCQETESIWHSRRKNIILPILVRLCVWLDSDRICKIIEFIQKLYNSYPDNLPELLATCYNSLSIDKAIELWWKIMKSPIILNYQKHDMVKPILHIKEWRGNSSVIDIITNGMANESLDIRRAAVNRFCDIHTILPNQYRNKIDKAICSNFDNLSKTNLSSILGVTLQLNENRIWNEQFLKNLHLQLNTFLNSDFTITSSSQTITNFENLMVLFINCHRHLTSQQKNLIFRKILCFVDKNFEVLCTTKDSDSFFGGMKRFLDSAMIQVNEFISETDCSVIQKIVIHRLINKFTRLTSSYPLICAIVNLSLNTGTKKTNKPFKDNQRLIRHWMEKGVTSSNKNEMYDTFLAAKKCYNLSNGNFSIQGIVRISIDHLRYFLNDVTVSILRCYPLWIDSGIIKKSNLKVLLELLSMLPQRISEDKDISADLKKDLLYYGGYLAGIVSKTKFIDVDKTDCVNNWLSFTNSHNFPYDICNGYFKGMYEHCC